jgi:hypothetical protein
LLSIRCLDDGSLDPDLRTPHTLLPYSKCDSAVRYPLVVSSIVSCSTYVQKCTTRQPHFCRISSLPYLRFLCRYVVQPTCSYETLSHGPNEEHFIDVDRREHHMGIRRKYSIHDELLESGDLEGIGCIPALLYGNPLSQISGAVGTLGSGSRSYSRAGRILISYQIEVAAESDIWEPGVKCAGVRCCTTPLLL